MDNMTFDRDTYRKYKKLDRAGMEALLWYYYNVGYDAALEEIDLEAMKTDIGEINGIGESRLEEIMDVIQMYLTLG